MTDPLDPPQGKPLWLMTLADLALLLLGFTVLIHATADRTAVARALAQRFGAAQLALPLAAAAASFAPGSAALSDPAPLIAWARDALRDPRTTVTVTGAADVSEGGILLATDRARAVVAALTRAGLPPERLALATGGAGSRATLSLAFTGQRSIR